MKKKPLVLIIMDGYGIRASDDGNAIAAAKKPHLDSYFKNQPHTVIGASGTAVGLPDGQMGNSEVGHTNIGAGRIVFQELARIGNAIQDQSVYNNSALKAAVEKCKSSGTA